MEKKSYNSMDVLLFLFYAAFGIFMFFVPVTFNEKKSIPLDHIVNLIRTIPNYSLIFGVAILFAGLAFSIKTKEYQKSKINLVFFVIKLLGLIFFFMYITKMGPERLFKPDMLPLIWDKIMVPVATIVPIGSIFLAFLIGFGLMEFIGIFMEPVMKPIWKTPGKSAIDAVASFVGSYSLALLITNRVYKEDQYTVKEAAIIATGFSTVSATFMIIVAKTLDILDHWLLYFWLTLIITFIVTAITARIYPLKNKEEVYFSGKEYVKEEKKKVSFNDAFNEGMKAFKKAPPLIEVIKKNFIDGFKMSLSIAPSLLSVGMIGLLIAEYTPFFDILGYIFYPFTAITKVPEPLLTAKALSLSIAEMLLPSALVTETPIVTRMLVAIVSVSEILFFSASIPCIMGTEIPIKFKDYIIIWIERVVLSILISAPILHLIFR